MFWQRTGDDIKEVSTGDHNNDWHLFEAEDQDQYYLAKAGNQNFSFVVADIDKRPTNDIINIFKGFKYLKNKKMGSLVNHTTIVLVLEKEYCAFPAKDFLCTMASGLTFVCTTV